MDSCIMPTFYISVRNELSRLLIEDLYNLVLLFNQPSVEETRGKMSLVMGELRFLGSSQGEDTLNQIEHMKSCYGCKSSFYKWVDGGMKGL
jgi:hypothetical protein